MSISSSTPSVDHQIWRACAGSGCNVPAVGSLIYYFPQGHVEQSTSPPNFDSLTITKPFSLCRVIAIDLRANRDTDEVFASVRLDPITNSEFETPRPFPPPLAADYDDCYDAGVGGSDEDKAVSFAKILTPSDANNGGGFSVPRYCADAIFPKLDLQADPPVQNIVVSDLHGTAWEFRHIYRGTPRRHLLTTGWSRFVNNKKLVAGDSVVFIKKNPGGRIFVGIRRTGRYCIANLDHLKLNLDNNAALGIAVAGTKDGFSRNVKGRVPPESIVKAVRLMEMARAFEVLYYPKAGCPEFLVNKEVVERTAGLPWSKGMRVKMSVATEDSSRPTSFQGIIASREVKITGPWMPSPWRMLQVNWDEPEVLQNIRAVSPWQVELISTQMQEPFPPLKKLRAPNYELSSEGLGKIFYPSSLIDSTKMGNLPSLVSYDTVSAGMQGARHFFGVPEFFSFVPKNSNYMLSDNFYGTNKSQDLNKSISSQGNILNNSDELLRDAAYNPDGKVSKGSFQLFGQIINMDQPKNDTVDEEYAEKEGVLSLDFSLTYPHKQLLDDLDVQHQRIQAVEAFNF